MDIKHLIKGRHLYGAKKKEIGPKVLEYTKQMETKHRTVGRCTYENISWFGGLSQAKQYHTSDTHVFRWKATRDIHLIKTSASNHSFFERLFTETPALHLRLHSSISLDMNKLRRVRNMHPIFQHSYLNMTINERAWYEFQFAFGYMTVDEQYSFLSLIYHLLDKGVTDIRMRGGDSIQRKVYLKMKYYELYPFHRKAIHNRLSFYEIDKYALVNLCKLVHYHKLRNVDGIFQMNTPSFWFPHMPIYHMNIQEYILFSPHHVLEYHGIAVE